MSYNTGHHLRSQYEEYTGGELKTEWCLIPGRTVLVITQGLGQCQDEEEQREG